MLIHVYKNSIQTKVFFTLLLKINVSSMNTITPLSNISMNMLFDMSWMNMILCNIVKLTKCKSGSCEDVESMSKWPKGSIHIGNIIYYLTYLPDLFSRGL